MTPAARALVGAMLTIVVIASADLRADTVQLSLRDGRLTLVAVNTTAARIFEVWSRTGGVEIVNAERMPATLLTLTLQDVPEEQALDTVLRAVSGYMARRRPSPASDASVFDRIIIIPTVAGVRPTAASSPLPPATAGRSAPAPQPPPTFSQGPGVGRLIGADGQPMEDDQADAPPAPFNGGDAPPQGGRAPAQPRLRPLAQPTPAPTSQAPAPQQTQPTGTAQPGVSSAPGVPQSGATTAPAGVPRPGMAMPSPAAPQPSPR